MDDHRIAAGIAHDAYEAPERGLLRFIEAPAGLDGRPAPAIDDFRSAS